MKCSRTHIDALLAANAKQVQQSILNVRLRRAFERTRRRQWGWDCPFTSTCHRVHPSLALGAKLLSIVDIVAWDFWVVNNGLHISKRDKAFFHSFFVYLRHACRERDCMSPCKPTGRSTPKRHSPDIKANPNAFLYQSL